MKKLINSLSKASEDVAIHSLSLHAVWNVCENKRYDVTNNQEKQVSGNLYAVRTLEGAGLVDLRENTITAKANSLLIFDGKDLIRYRCIADLWRFWWFEFRLTESVLGLPINTYLEIAVQADEHKIFEDIFYYFKHENSAEQHYAVSLFYMMLCQWKLHSNQQKQPLYYTTINDLIDKIHSSLDKHWKVSQMASFCNMSERNFRSVFYKLKGLPPKKYVEHMKMEHAKEMLQLGIYSIQQIAEKTGYSSAFHFSKNFSKFYGYPPSKFE